MRKIISRLVSGLRWRLLLLVLLACAPLVGLALHTASEERRRLVKDWKQRSQEMMEQATREETQVVGQTRQLLLALAGSSPVRSEHGAEAESLLDALFGSYPRYANLGVVTTNGRVLASARPMPGLPSPTNRLFFRRVLATRNFANGDFQDTTADGLPAITFGYPVFGATGQVQAVVFATLDLEWVSRFESALPAQLPAGATWTEIDRSGKILVRYPMPEQWIGKPFPDKPLLASAFARDRGVVEAVSAGGVPGYHAFAARRSQFVPDDVVTILSSIPRQVLFADVDRRLRDNLTGLAVAGGLAFALGWIGSYLLVLRPVRALVKSSVQLATGEFSTRTGLPPKGDELGQLTRTFDQMAQSLELRESERASADHALKASELRYRRLFESAQDGILILNADNGQINDVNPFLTNLLGYTRAELLGNKLWEIGPFHDIQASKAEFRELQREAYVRYDDLPLETRAGKAIHVEFVSNVYQVNGGRVIQCNIRNITERKQAEARHQSYSRKLQVLSRRLVEAQETERRNLARELHDEIGQALTVMQLNLQALLQTPGMEALPHGRTRLTESLAVAERVLDQVRDISLNLRPSILDDLGLEPALRWYTDRQAALMELKIEFHAAPLEQRLDAVVETECFRVAQEALTNVARHAHAQTVNVELRQEAGQIHLRVRDDGIGFDVAAVRERAVRGASLGLLSMEERAALAGGGLEFISIPRQGTEVHAWFPLKWQNSAPPTPATAAKAA